MKTKGKKGAAGIEPVVAAKPGEPSVEALDVSLAPQELKRELVKALDEVSKLHVELPAGILTPAMAGDPGAEIPGTEPEPIYDAAAREDIQGNTIPGFNKDHQHFLFFRIGRVAAAKRWLRWIAPLIASMEEVLAFVRAHRRLRHRLGIKEPPLQATWVNIAFSRRAIARLAGAADADAFGDQSFRQGLAARSTYLGDPTNPRHPGHRRHWVVGGSSKREADILVIVAADNPGDLASMVGVIKRRAEEEGVGLLFEQRGATLPGRLRGHEHFGFKDGVSQPGVRGKVSAAPGDFITPRYLDAAADRDRARLFAKPGQLLLWPGQFLLGEPRQNPEDFFSSYPAATNFPRWARLGSYLVCRRLRQDVLAFWQFAAGAAAALGIPTRQLASMLVGRWPSGAPIMRTPLADDPALAGDEWANNHFIYDDDTRAAALRPIPGYGGDAFPQARQDFLGAVCPHFAHVRKTNPRDIATDLGKPADSLIRMILRRGIPFGPPVLGKRITHALLPRLSKPERGLMFVCYGATIEEQFEFLTRRWVNSPLQPNVGGHDPVIGQRDARGARGRFIDVPTAAGTRRIVIKNEWVTPTGGGYFFSPPIQAITAVLGA